MKVNLHNLKKKLPKPEDVQTLIVEKKKIHRKVTRGIEPDQVSIRSGLQKLHYSELSRSPRLSDLGPGRSEPENLITPYMQNVHKNVNKAFDYQPPKDARPEFDLHAQDPSKQTKT